MGESSRFTELIIKTLMAEGYSVSAEAAEAWARAIDRLTHEEIAQALADDGVSTADFAFLSGELP